MKRTMVSAVLACLLAVPCFAAKAMMFNSVDQYLDRANGIWVLQVVRKTGTDQDGRPVYEAKVLLDVKGSSEKVLRISSVFNELSLESRYLFFAFGRLSDGKGWMDNGNLSPVPIPRSFGLSDLEGKPPTEQISMIVSARMAQIEVEMKRLSDEREALSKAGVCGALPAGPSALAGLGLLDKDSAKGLTIVCSPQKAEYTVGERIWLDCRITNTVDTAKPIAWNSNVGCHFLLTQDKDLASGLLPQAHPIIRDPMLIRSGYPETTARIFYLPPGKWIDFCLDGGTADRSSKFHGRLVYDPLAPRDDFVLDRSDRSAWRSEVLVSDIITYEIRADGGKQ